MSLQHIHSQRRLLISLFAAWLALRPYAVGQRAYALEPCAIEVVDGETGWPVPLVELKTIHGVRFVTDNAGRIAFDLPELMGRETWFTVAGQGYEVPADGFAMRGVRLVPQPGRTRQVTVNRTAIAKRLGRLTGAGLFAESQKLGLESDWRESGVLGCDSVQNAVYRGKLYWAWGDTSLANYPLGLFHMTGATTTTTPLTSFEPPVRLSYRHFTKKDGTPRTVANMPGSGPSWVIGCANLPDANGRERLVGTYLKVHPPMDTYAIGLCAWDDESEQFEHVDAVWTRNKTSPDPPASPRGHSIVIKDDDGKLWVLFGDPLPQLRCPATFEAWRDPSTWERLAPPEYLISAADGAKVKPHGGSIAWNVYRKAWVTVFVENLEKNWPCGEVWYAEAAAATGPWGPAVKILSHDNYSFYNPSLHPEFAPEGSPILLFEGTYSALFADKPQPTPRYDYNQILYRLDLDDPKLAPAHLKKSGS